MSEFQWRRPRPTDHARILAVVDDWWGGRQMAAMIPRLFIDHFAQTSYVVDDEHGDLSAFAIAFVSPAEPAVTYVHFIGVDPARRGQGLGRQIYDRLSEQALTAGCDALKAVTSPINLASQAFHRRMGFTVSTPVPDYDGAGEDRVLLTKALQPRS